MSKTLGSLTVGAKIEVPVLSAYQSRFGSKIVFKIADKNHSGYPSNSVTLITEKIIQNMASDAKEPSNSNNDRKNYGNISACGVCGIIAVAVLCADAVF